MLALGCLQIGRIAARPKAPGEQQPRTRAAADKQLATGQPLWFFFTARHALHGRVIEWDCAGWKAYCGSEGWQTKRGSVSLPGRNAQARNFDLWAAVHHHFQSCGLRALGGGFIDDADLHPDRFGARLYGIIHSLSRSLATAEDIDHIDGNADLIQTGPDEFTVHMLPSDLRIDRYHAMALFLKKSHDAIARPRRIVRDADHGDSVRFAQELRNIFILYKRHVRPPSNGMWGAGA